MKKKTKKIVNKRVARKAKNVWKVYILETDKGQLYTGITNNLERRLKMHQKGQGALYTKFFGAKKILYTEDRPDRSSALKREHAIKQWTRSQKFDLIAKRSNKERRHACRDH